MPHSAVLISRYIAHWIKHGSPPYELIEADPTRFGVWTDRVFAAAKGRESYGMNTAVLWPKEERFAGRPTSRANRKLMDLLKNEGAEFTFKSGWEASVFIMK